MKRFWSKVNKTDTCWLWTAAKGSDGYGLIKIKYKMLRAHRIAWTLVNGDIPEGMLVCHTCDNPSCVNPNHLFLGTSLDNVRDMLSKGRRKFAASEKLSSPGESNPAAKITRVQVEEIRCAYAKGCYTQSDVGKMYGISKSTIGAIIRHEIWK